MLTYGDGLCTVDLGKLLEFHRSHGKLATVTAVNIAQLKGVMEVEDDGRITAFREKNDRDAAIINGGFMVFEPGFLDYLKDDDTVLEQEPFSRLCEEGQMMSFYHDGFWQCMDTQREKKKLEELWASGRAPWKIW